MFQQKLKEHKGSQKCITFVVNIANLIFLYKWQHSKKSATIYF
jgi:hypothetical protein